MNGIKRVKGVLKLQKRLFVQFFQQRPPSSKRGPLIAQLLVNDGLLQSRAPRRTVQKQAIAAVKIVTVVWSAERVQKEFFFAHKQAERWRDLNLWWTQRVPQYAPGVSSTATRGIQKRCLKLLVGHCRCTLFVVCRQRFAISKPVEIIVRFVINVWSSWARATFQPLMETVVVLESNVLLLDLLVIAFLVSPPCFAVFLMPTAWRYM